MVNMQQLPHKQADAAAPGDRAHPSRWSTTWSPSPTPTLGGDLDVAADVARRLLDLVDLIGLT